MILALNIILVPIFLVGTTNAMTWWPTDELLWESQEAQEFFERYFSECPYTSEEYEAVENYTEAMGFDYDQRCNAEIKGVDMENCCTIETPCTLGGGYCDNDDQCKEGLVCQPKSCRGWITATQWRRGDTFDPDRSCCAYKPGVWDVLGGDITDEMQALCIPEGVEIPQDILNYEKEYTEYFEEAERRKLDEGIEDSVDV